MQRECKKHGLTDYVKEGTGYYRCKKCRMDAVAKRRKKLKQIYVDYKGGQCVLCGYNKCIEALDFHHVDDQTKEFGIAHKGKTLSLEKVKTELDKCVLLCSNCHREVHSGVTQLVECLTVEHIG